MSSSGLFKAKRPRSFDGVGIANYKRQRLIADFESLRLDDRTEPSYGGDDGSFSKVVSLNLDLGRSVGGSSNFSEKFYQDIREDLWLKRFQVVKWVDWRKVIYAGWVKWINQRYDWYRTSDDLNYALTTKDTGHSEVAMDEMNCDNYIIAQDEDIDMD